MGGPMLCSFPISCSRTPASAELTKISILSRSTNGARTEAAAAPVNANPPGATRVRDSAIPANSAPKGFEHVKELRRRQRYRSLYFCAHRSKRRAGSGTTIAEFLLRIQSSCSSVLRALEIDPRLILNVLSRVLLELLTNGLVRVSFSNSFASVVRFQALGF